MPTHLYPINIEHTTSINDQFDTKQATTALESGRIIFCPNLSFQLQAQEKILLTPKICDTQKKNISYDYQKKRLSGISDQNPHQSSLHLLMHRYAEFAKNLVDKVLPEYQSTLRWGRTSYRPIEIKGRHRSKRQDDTRIHVDAFPSTPVDGLRILRVFCNINPEGQARTWHLGESFTDVLAHFATQLPRYNHLKSKFLHWVKATKSLRSPYDHYMLALHDAMKLDDIYQATFKKHQMDFPAQSTWIVFTDHVSHAALGGQYLLEQTFYLPVSSMIAPTQSPLIQIKKLGLAGM